MLNLAHPRVAVSKINTDIKFNKGTIDLSGGTVTQDGGLSFFEHNSAIDSSIMGLAGALFVSLSEGHTLVADSLPPISGKGQSTKCVRNTSTGKKYVIINAINSRYLTRPFKDHRRTNMEIEFGALVDGTDIAGRFLSIDPTENYMIEERKRYYDRFDGACFLIPTDTEDNSYPDYVVRDWESIEEIHSMMIEFSGLTMTKIKSELNKASVQEFGVELLVG